MYFFFSRVRARRRRRTEHTSTNDYSIASQEYRQRFSLFIHYTTHDVMISIIGAVCWTKKLEDFFACCFSGEFHFESPFWSPEFWFIRLLFNIIITSNKNRETKLIGQNNTKNQENRKFVACRLLMSWFARGERIRYDCHHHDDEDEAFFVDTMPRIL